MGGLHFADVNMLPAGAAPIVQTKSALVGPPGDAYEKEADRVAEEVTSSAGQKAPPPLQNDPTSTVRRHPGAAGAPQHAGLPATLGAALGGGSALSPSLRENFEGKFGADFGGVRIHTDSAAAGWNRSLQSRAFTTGQDIFFAAGEYRPETREGHKVLAHELTHVGQQNPGLLGEPLLHDQTRLIRPLRLNPKNQRYYSDAAPGLQEAYKADTTDQAFLTATSNSGPGGGHTTIYVEHFDQSNGYAPVNTRIELFRGPRGGINISIKPYRSDEVQAKLFDLGSPFKKTWKKTRANAVAALAKAEEIKTNQARYTYYKLGKGPTWKNSVLNCARFGQRVLQAAGIDLHLGALKLPSGITNPLTNNGALANGPTNANLLADATSVLPNYCRQPSEFLEAAQVHQDDPNAIALAVAAQALKTYHQQQETVLRAGPLINALNQLTHYVKATAAADFVARRSDPTSSTLAGATITFLKATLQPALKREVLRLRGEIFSDVKMLAQNHLPKAAYVDLGLQMKEALDKLTDLLRYDSLDKLVRERVKANISHSPLHKNKYQQILKQGEQDFLFARLD